MAEALITPTADETDPVDQTEELPEPYTPTAKELQLTGEIEKKFQDWRKDRQPHEPQWFVTSAMFSGNSDVYWPNIDSRLAALPAPPTRIRRKINRIFAKV